MPQQRTAKPAAERDAFREAEAKQRRGVVDLPARHDHHDHRHRVDPMHGSHPGRLDDPGRGHGLMTFGGCKAGHGSSPSFKSALGEYTRYFRLRYCHPAIKSMLGGHRRQNRLHEKASRVAPLALDASRPGPDPGGRIPQDAGSSTVSITWMTPFDWLTLEMVTIEESPLASMIMTWPPARLTIRSSPWTVLSFLPSVRSEASSLPATTW